METILNNSFSEHKSISFKEAYDTYWDLLFGTAVLKVGSKQDAYDIVQELFIELWENPSLLTSIRSHRSFLLGVLYNKIFLHFRKKGLRQKHYDNFEAYIQLLHENAAGPALKEQEEQWAAVNLAIQREIANMPERMQQILVLNRYQQRSISEIAQSLSLSPQTVKNQLQLALKRLRQLGHAYPVGVCYLWCFHLL